MLRLKANKQKVELAMARAHIGLAELKAKTQMPEPTIKNVLYGRGVRPASLGRVATALGVDPAEMIEQEA